MRLTLLKAKEYLANKSQADQINYRLNRVCERYLLSGKFMGSMSRLKLAAPFGQVALPRGYRTLEGVKVNGRVYDIANRWWDFLPGKANAYGPVLSIVEDWGDGHATMYVPTRLTVPYPTDKATDFPPGQGTIAVDYSGSETLTLHIEGRDGDEMPISLDFTGKQTLTNPFARISLIRKQVTDVGMTVKFTGPNDAIYGGAVTTLAIMEPDEEEAYYRKYFIPTLVQQPTVAIEGFSKRRHIEFTRDTDVLPFTNIGALGLGLDAYQAESEGDKTLANQFWADGVALLNSELGDANAADQIPAIRFHWPGNTTPKLTSHF